MPALVLEEAHCSFDDVFGLKAEFCLHLGIGAGSAEDIADTDQPHFHGSFLGRDFGDGRAEAAVDIVVVDGDDAACFVCGFDDGVFVDRF